MVNQNIKLEDDGYCFVCGKNNREGLKINWTIAGKTTRAEFVPLKKFQGFKDILHGGIITSLLDEAMGRLAWIVYGNCISVEIEVRFIHPAKINEKLLITGEIVNTVKRIIYARSEIKKEDGTKIATATGKILLLKA
ncbi:MAG TPA: hypothetical protein DHV62_04615 [Elusimicrobia bacterium]|jgi:uncharacterized protein (TIGR00369 family)|nr:hypothetical protein [Elusimicrobiota bacterium]